MFLTLISPSKGRQHTILPKFPKNCMKLKEFEPPGGASLVPPPLDPPLDTVTDTDTDIVEEIGTTNSEYAPFLVQLHFHTVFSKILNKQ